MALSVGQNAGPYTITAPLGAGGMGEVYRATDTRLGRDVAIKLLPAELAQDPDRLARFEREAKLLASLNHPNIAHVYGFENATLPDGSAVHILAMELVPGEDLAERLKRSAIPVDEAIAIAKQIADALEEAHENGIVHRDLKPANVKLTADGKVKVLDFGLAKAWDGPGDSSPDLSQSPTLAHTGTAAGVILGTAAYMSPEQARGRVVDKRADIWAFGVVLFEMLTGRRPFGGETASEILAAVIKDRLDLSALDPTVPAGIRRLIDRCLKKEPRERLRDIGDAHHELDEVRGVEPPQTVAPITALGSRIVSLAPWLLAVVLALTTLLLWSGRSQKAHATPVRRFAIDLPWQSVPNWTDFDVAVSPSGIHLAYYGRRENDVHAYVRRLDSLEAVALAEAREADDMVFSPDGEWLLVHDPHGLRKVSIHGGRAQELRPLAPADGRGLSWGSDGGILIGHPSGLLRAPSTGGPAVALTHVDRAAGETAHAEPFLLPGGRQALMTIERGGERQLAIVELEGATVSRLQLSGSQPVYSPTGHLVFRQGTTVLAARFDVGRLALVGEAVPVLEGVRRGPYLAEDGTMVYVPERGDSSARLVWIDRAGHPTPIPGERLDYSHLALDHEGKQALLDIGRELYVRDIERGTRRLLSSDDGSFPIWSADTRWAIYGAETNGKYGLFRQPADGSAEPETLHVAEGRLVPSSWNSRTGELAFFDAASDIWILSPDGKARRFLGATFNERSGHFSPDGRWLAYVSDETSSYQVYVVPYPGPGPKVAVSVDGGLSPVWSSNGRELYFCRGGKMLAVTLTFTPTLLASKPVELFDGPYTLDLMGHQRYDVAPDGRFMMVENSDDFRIVLVQNWAEELERLVPAVTKP